MSTHNPLMISSTRQSVIGLSLAAAICGVWLLLHIWSVFFFDLTGSLWPLIPVIVALQVWLYVGMFIVAHDAMHGSLVPGNGAANTWLGRIILLIYAGFGWGNLQSAHMQHHKTPGTEEDPDFYAGDPSRFWTWYFVFFKRYFGVTQLLIISAQVLVYMYLFGASLFNIWVFWALPSIASSAQLFYFGTYLPHRHEEVGFADEHNARTNNYPWLMSLLTCFHFGYHHEHHLYPHEPWWRLPLRRAERMSGKAAA